MADGVPISEFKINKLGYRILGVIARAPQSGYDIVKALIKFRRVNISQVYPIVTEMEAHGMLRCEEVVQSGKPNKKVYHLLQPGRALLQDWIAGPTDPPEPRDEFVAKVFSLWTARPQDRARLIHERLGQLDTEMAYFSGKLDALHSEHSDSTQDPETWQFCRNILMQRRMALYRDEIQWCHEVLRKLECAPNAPHSS